MLKRTGKIRGIYLRGEVYWFAKQVNGRRSHITLETRDYAEAVQRAQEILNRPELQPARSMSAEIERFVQHKLDTNRFSSASADVKRYILRGFAASVRDAAPVNVTVQQCKAFYNTAKARVSPSTAQGYAFTLRSFFHWCVAENLCHRNPAMEVQLDRVDHKVRTLFADLELAQKLIAEAPDDDLRFMLYCGFHVGMRRLEIVEARPEWFNLRARTLEIRASDTFRPKDRDARTVPLTDQFVEFLERYGLRSPFVLKPEVGHGSFRYRYDIRRPFMLYMKAQGTRQGQINYHLVFASQHPLGLEKMKEAMKAVDKSGTYSFSDDTVDQGLLDFDFDAPAEWAFKMQSALGGKSLPYSAFRDFALTETPFTNPKAMLKHLKGAGKVQVAWVGEPAKQGFPEEKIRSILILK